MKTLLDKIALWLTAAATIGIVVVVMSSALMRFHHWYLLFLVCAFLMLLWQCHAYWRASSQSAEQSKKALAALLGSTVMFVVFVATWVLRPSVRLFCISCGIALGNVVIDQLWRRWGLEATQEQEAAATPHDETVWPPPPMATPPNGL